MRTTKKTIEYLFNRVCEVYKLNNVPEINPEENSNQIFLKPFWSISNECGYRIDLHNVSTSINCPFGYDSRNAREMECFLKGMLAVAQLKDIE